MSSFDGSNDVERELDKNEKGMNFLSEMNFSSEPSLSEPTARSLEPSNVVELATLALPRSAIDAGMEVGGGNHVVLEASNETVDHIQMAMTGASPLANDEGAMNRLTSTALTATTAEPPSISAVVDLEKLSKLVGATETDLITNLQQGMQEVRAAATKAASEGENDQEGPDEGTPLLKKKSSSDEEERGETGTDQITLLADPFIEKLVETLPTVQEDASMVGVDPGDAGDTVTVAMTTIAVDGAMADEDQGDNESPEEQHYARDAFLLDLPTTDTEGRPEHHYVLALPEILVEESVQTAASELSEEDEHFGFAPLLERAMTIKLPTDIENLHLEAAEHVPTEADPTVVHLDIVVERKVPVIGYTILLLGLFALSSVGAALDLQQGGVSPTMKTVWRQVATSLVMLPMVIKSLLWDGIPQLTFNQWLKLPAAAAAYAYMTVAFVFALEMTTMANAFVLSNMTSLVIIAGRFLLRMPVLPMEGGGTITGFVGAAICSQDGADVSSSENGLGDGVTAFWGDMIAFSASIGTTAYFLIAKDLRPKMDLFVFMFFIMACGSCFSVFFMLASGETFTLDLHPVHGFFGWMAWQPDRLALELYMAIVCNLMGTTGYIAVMKYFDPLVPATVMLLEPVIGTILGVVAGTANLPGLQTWLGNLVVAGGTFLVIYSGSSKKESIDATEALRARASTIGGVEEAIKTTDVMKSPLVPRHSPALTKGSCYSKKMANSLGDNPSATNTKVIWEV